MQKHEGQVLNQFGRPIISPTITVYRTGTQSLAPIYSADTVASPTLNPLTGSAVGHFSFYVADGRYDIAISGSDFSTAVETDVSIFDSTGTSSSSDSPWLIYNVVATVVDIAGVSSAPDLAPVDSGRLYYDTITNKIRYSQDGSAYTDLSGGVTHNLFSSTHPDTVVNSPVLGDVIYANSSQLWTKLGGNTTSTKKLLSQTGTGSISAAPAWSALVAGDIPSLAASILTSGTVALARGGTNADLSASGSSTAVLAQDASHVVTARALIAADIPSLAASKITSGTLALAQGGTNADLSASGSATAVLAQDGSHVVSARALVAADIPNLAGSIINSGTLVFARMPLSVRQTEIPLVCGRDVTWTTMPAGLTEFAGLTAFRDSYDVTDFTQFRLIVAVTTAAGGTATLRAEYSTNAGSTWADLETGSGTTHEVSVTSTSPAPKIGTLVTKDASATGDVLLRITGINGDGVASPVFRQLKIQFR